MAVKKVIIHLGMPKAGSRSIQETLFNNTNILEENGFRYLHEWRRNHLDKFHYLLSPYPVKPIGTKHLGRPLPKRKKLNKIAISKMWHVINTTKCETLILSGEYFHELYLDETINNIKEFIANYFQSKNIETTIVYVIRNPLTWMVSWLQQRIPHNGYLSKSGDFFDSAIQKYEGIINLKKFFPDSLKIVKFEDACLDKDGFVEHFLKAVDFPVDELKKIDVFRSNESRCMELMEFAHFIEDIEPLYPFKNYRRRNPNRFYGDLNILRHIKGMKFDLSYQSKNELWSRLGKTIHRVKESTGIDYTDYTVPPPSASDKESYSEETIQDFIEVFPKLSYVLQKHFLKFFEKKYMETGREKFKKLHFQNSIPWNLYKSKVSFLHLFRMRINYRLQEVKEAVRLTMPQSAKHLFKPVSGK